MRKINENSFGWSYFLDNNKKDTLTIKYVISESGKKVTEFVIIYTTLIAEIPKEVIKYDVSNKEKMHTHYNYQNPKKKSFYWSRNFNRNCIRPSWVHWKKLEKDEAKVYGKVTYYIVLWHIMLYNIKSYKGEFMEKLIIKIGSAKDVKNELRKVFNDPTKGKNGTHTLYLKNSKDFYEILSPQRLDLLRYITGNPFEKNTISELAKKLERKQEAISRDTTLLCGYKMIQKTKEKQKVYVKALYKSLDLELA